MSKRLRIAKKLLSDRGVIFISIDDNEQANLKLLCDEIFPNRYLATLVWKSKSGGANDTSAFGVDHEYVLCYCGNPAKYQINNDMEAVVTTSYNKVDTDGRRYALDRLDKQSLGYQESLDFPIQGPDGKIYQVEHRDINHKKARWRWGKSTVEERYDELVFQWPYVYTKNYEKNDGQKPRSILFEDRFGRTRTGSTDLKAVLGNQNIFSYPKPINLLKFLIGLGSSQESTILDFFAGSGTTLHAVMQLNADDKDGGKRQCILCTNNENGICENVTYERNKRVISGYTKPNGEFIEGLHDNNLHYYRTAFVSRRRTPQNMRRLMLLASDMLCIKEDLYTEIDTFGELKTLENGFRYFAKGDKQMLIIYNEEAIYTIIEQLEQMIVAEPIIVYVFSLGNDAWNSEFVTVSEKVCLTALPSAIYNAYKQVLPKAKDISLTTDVEPDEATTVTTQSHFDDGEGGNEQ